MNNKKLYRLIFCFFVGTFVISSIDIKAQSIIKDVQNMYTDWRARRALKQNVNNIKKKIDSINVPLFGYSDNEQLRANIKQDVAAIVALGKLTESDKDFIRYNLSLKKDNLIDSSKYQTYYLVTRLGIPVSVVGGIIGGNKYIFKQIPLPPEQRLLLIIGVGGILACYAVKQISYIWHTNSRCQEGLKQVDIIREETQKIFEQAPQQPSHVS